MAWRSHTEDTDDEFKLGGFTYSHGATCLIHQHWVEQVITAGGFNVHCTQSAEAAHKTSAKLASSRVRHLHGMQTVNSMAAYLCTHTVFEHLKYYFPDPPSKGPACPIVYGVKVPLMNNHGTYLLMAGQGSFTTRRFQSQLLHKEIPVTRVELMDGSINTAVFQPQKLPLKAGCDLNIAQRRPHALSPK